MEGLKWIKIKDALPPMGKTVITTDKNKIGIGSWSYSQSHPNNQNWTSSEEIWQPTHWMHFPKL